MVYSRKHRDEAHWDTLYYIASVTMHEPALEDYMAFDPQIAERGYKLTKGHDTGERRVHNDDYLHSTHFRSYSDIFLFSLLTLSGFGISFSDRLFVV